MGLISNWDIPSPKSILLITCVMANNAAEEIMQIYPKECLEMIFDKFNSIRMTSFPQMKISENHL